jgi:hypothetical protein
VFEPIAKGNRFEFDPDSVLDWGGQAASPPSWLPRVQIGALAQPTT